ncbi:uncharacterized protein K452DRAFT_212214, partial [Aplosporella prunicola CBS 121167]
SLIVGDFNCHHPWWDPGCSTSQEGNRLLDWIESNNLTLLNNPGEATRFRQGNRASVIDLTLASNSISNRIQDWQILEDIGSDHRPILFSI